MRRRRSKAFRNKVSVTRRMPSRAFLLVLLTTFTVTISKEPESQLKIGRSMNLFSRYGYLSLSMRVVPRNDTTWLFREPTVDIFTIDLDSFTERPKRFTMKSVFQGEFHMEFCDNLEQLLQAYFRDFRFERLEKPWKAFTASWAPEVAARHLGINSSFAHGDHCYVLVRLSRYRNQMQLQTLPGNVDVDRLVEDEIDKVTVGDATSVLNFIQKFGTHYINSFTTGNSLYQVFVYRRPVYLRIKDRLKTRGIAQVGDVELANYFSPWYAEHMGAIKVASGNKTIERWASNKLRVNYYIFTYPSLLKVHGDLQLLRTLNRYLQSEAILEMDMRANTPAFKDPEKREWFVEVLDNVIKLWDSNM